MFKNLVLSKLTDFDRDPRAAEIRAADAVFAPCGPTQQRSVGWVPPREANGALVEVIAGQWIMAAQIETKTVPVAVLDKTVTALAAQIERETGRKPGKKQRQELKGQALIDLLPKAFPKSVKVMVWIDPMTNTAAFDTPSASSGELLASLTAATLSAGVAPLNCAMPPGQLLTAWLLDGAPDFPGFEVSRECVLQHEKTRVSYTDADLDTAEVKHYIAACGMHATRVGLEWDKRVSFTLSDNMALGRVEILDVGSGEFDANVTLTTGALRPLIAALVGALGGEAP